MTSSTTEDDATMPDVTLSTTTQQPFTTVTNNTTIDGTTELHVTTETRTESSTMVTTEVQLQTGTNNDIDMGSDVTSTFEPNFNTVEPTEGSSGSGLSTMEIGIFAAAGFMFIVIIIICTVVCFRCICKPKKRDKKKPSGNDQSQDIHVYQSKITDGLDEPMNYRSNPGTQRYTRDPTVHHASPPDDDQYQEMSDVNPHYADSSQVLSGRYPHRPVADSDTYAHNIVTGYRGSKQKDHNIVYNQMDQDKSHAIQMEPRGPQTSTNYRVPNIRTDLGYHENQNTRPDHIYDTRITQEPTPNNAGRAHTVVPTNPAPQPYSAGQVPLAVQPHLGVQPRPSVHPHSQAPSHPRAQNYLVQTQPRVQPHPGVQIRPSGQPYADSKPYPELQTAPTMQTPYKAQPSALAGQAHPGAISANRKPRYEPHFIPYGHKTPPPTQPKPQPSINMAELKGKLRPTKRQDTNLKQTEQVNEVELNPLFLKLRHLIDDGCKTMRLYKTSQGFAVQGFDADEQDIYNDAETSRAHLPVDSVPLVDCHYDDDADNIYDVIRSSIIINSGRPAEVQQHEDTADAVYEDAGETAEAQVNGALYDEPSNIQHEARYDNSSRKLAQVIPKDPLIQELQYRQATNTDQSVPQCTSNPASKPEDLPPTGCKRPNTGYINDTILNTVHENEPQSHPRPGIHHNAEFKNPDLIKELQQKQTEQYEQVESTQMPAPSGCTRSPPGYVNDQVSGGLNTDIPAPTACYGPSPSYVNEDVVNALSEAGPQGLRHATSSSNQHQQEVYENHDVLTQASEHISTPGDVHELYQNETEIERIRNAHTNQAFQADYPQEEYENVDVIQALHQSANQYSQEEYENTSGIQNLHQTVKESEPEVYENATTISNLRRPKDASTEESVYQNSLEIQKENDPSSSKVNGSNDLDPDLASKLDARRRQISLRSSMGDAELGENVGQLFDEVLKGSLRDIHEELGDESTHRASKHKPPVMRKKASTRTSSDQHPYHSDVRISRSSLFAEIEAESGPDNRQNVGGWHQRDAITPQMVATGTKALPKSNAGPFNLFKNKR